MIVRTPQTLKIDPERPIPFSRDSIRELLHFSSSHPSGGPHPPFRISFGPSHRSQQTNAPVEDELQTLLRSTPPPARRDVFACLDCDLRRGSRFAACAFLMMFVIFVTACCILLIVIIFRVDRVLESIDTEPITNHLHSVLDEAHYAATESRAFGTDLRSTLKNLTPALLDTINSTHHMVNDVKGFSHHPAFTISAAVPALAG